MHDKRYWWNVYAGRRQSDAVEKGIEFHKDLEREYATEYATSEAVNQNE